MTVLVAYASRYGSTAQIAERIAQTLTTAGHEATALPASEVRDLTDAAAVVVGSCVYFGSWGKDATTFVQRNHEGLATLPVWLFSSGPLPGSVIPNDKDADPTPKGIADLTKSLGAVEHRVFDGALDRAKLSLRDRLIRTLPAGRGLLPEVDGRNWPAIEEWAQSIARELDHTT